MKLCTVLLPLLGLSAAVKAAMAGMTDQYEELDLLKRQTADAPVLDFTELPTCAQICLTRWRALPCTTNPPTLDCFCELINPLDCISLYASTNPGCWSSAETWYSTQCPNVPAVNISSIPSCAQGCFNEEDTGKYCKNDLTRNCVCSMGQPVCNGNCTGLGERASFDGWWKEECGNGTTTTTTTRGTTTATATKVTGVSLTATGTSDATASTTSGAAFFYLLRKPKREEEKGQGTTGAIGGVMGSDGRDLVEMGTDGALIAEMESPIDAPMGRRELDGGEMRRIYEKA